MTRVKRGPYRRRRHKKILRMMKGQFGTRHRLFRRANEAIGIGELANAIYVVCGSPESMLRRA